jgi:dolichyl-phosphate-mannose--protein O-mannosyl transferase
VVVLAGLMARELGGGRCAQGLAARATLVASSFLVMDTFLSMDAFDQLFWISAAYVLLLILERDESRLWLLFDLIMGLGLAAPEVGSGHPTRRSRGAGWSGSPWL